MNLEAIGLRVLPWVAAVLEDAVDYLLALQVYVERWHRLLDDHTEADALWAEVYPSGIDLDAVAEAL